MQQSVSKLWDTLEDRVQKMERGWKFDSDQEQEFYSAPRTGSKTIHLTAFYMGFESPLTGSKAAHRGGEHPSVH